MEAGDRLFGDASASFPPSFVEHFTGASFMSAELILYSNPMSRGRIARWMLEEVGQPYRIEYLHYGTTMRSPEFLEINPMGKVPTLRHGEAIVTEAAAICAYLAAVFPEAGLEVDRATPAYAAYLRWLFFGAGPVESAVTAKALGLLAPPDKRATVGYGDFGSVMDTLEFAVEGKDYIAGERFSAADVYVGAQIGWGLQFGTIESRPAFVAYRDRIEARPAFQRAKALDDEAMHELQRQQQQQ
jgi:glutathione S-transferase